MFRSDGMGGATTGRYHSNIGQTTRRFDDIGVKLRPAGRYETVRTGGATDRV